MGTVDISKSLSSTRGVGQYLHYGYLVCDRVDLPVSVTQGVPAKGSECAYDSWSLDALVAEGVVRFRAALAGTLSSEATTSDYVVPISGGLDSRAIVGGLLEHVDRSRIHAVTFGMPGTWDFELGRAVAGEAGLCHTAIDLSTVPWRGDLMVRFAGQCECPVPLFEAYLFHQTRCHYNDGYVYWSGFMGDPLSGSHLLKEDSRAWEQAKSRFASRNRFTRSVNLAPPGFSAESNLPAIPPMETERLCYDEQLDMGVRQQRYIRPVVMLNGYEYRTPFLHPEWVSFILNVPRRYRAKQQLYKEILMTAYPRLFSLPVTNSLGLSLGTPVWRTEARRVNLCIRRLAKRVFPSLCHCAAPYLKYIDFDRCLRQREDLKRVVYESIQDLKKRQIVDWIDIDVLWQRHQDRLGNYADALTLLASLEINLKAKESKPK